MEGQMIWDHHVIVHTLLPHIKQLKYPLVWGVISLNRKFRFYFVYTFFRASIK